MEANRLQTGSHRRRRRDAGIQIPGPIDTRSPDRCALTKGAKMPFVLTLFRTNVDQIHKLCRRNEKNHEISILPDHKQKELKFLRELGVVANITKKTFDDFALITDVRLQL
ncbi:hypothetical protein ACJJTC_013127 [Scirpophaga incertulas]